LARNWLHSRYGHQPLQVEGETSDVPRIEHRKVYVQQKALGGRILGGAIGAALGHHKLGALGAIAGTLLGQHLGHAAQEFLTGTGHPSFREMGRRYALSHKPAGGGGGAPAGGGRPVPTATLAGHPAGPAFRSRGGAPAAGHPAGPAFAGGGGKPAPKSRKPRSAKKPAAVSPPPTSGTAPAPAALQPHGLAPARRAPPTQLAGSRRAPQTHIPHKHADEVRPAMPSDLRAGVEVIKREQ
jgi:hypothetical protein